MPLLGALLAAITGSITSFLALLFAKKISFAVLAITAFAAALAILMATFNLFVAPLVAAMFQTQFGQFIGLAFPPISGSCMTAIGACWSACTLYKLKIQSIRMSASV